MAAAARAGSAAAGPALQYRNSVMLAPMVRVGTLPSRLLALRYGADIVYGEELIDYKMLNCKRRVNEVLDTVDYALADGTLVFRTCAVERSRLVFQLGTASPERAVQVAMLVQQDVAGLDINMGCPKDFSLKGGMGAALLKHPDQAAAIVAALTSSAFRKPVTCKIRLLGTLDATLALARRLEAAGAHAIGIHGRLTHQRPREPVTPEQCAMIRAVSEALSIPVIANGGGLDIRQHSDIAAFKEATGCSSVMLARPAQWNMSVFRREGLLDPMEVAREYVRLAVQYDNPVPNSKYCLQGTLHNQMVTDAGQAMVRAITMDQVCTAFGMPDLFRQAVVERHAHMQRKRPADRAPELARKRLRQDEGGTVSAPIMWKRKLLGTVQPKNILSERSQKGLATLYPEWKTVEGDLRGFISTLTFEGGQYTSTVPNCSKKAAEQAAALVAILHLRLLPEEQLEGVRRTLGLLPCDDEPVS